MMMERDIRLSDEHGQCAFDDAVREAKALRHMRQLDELERCRLQAVEIARQGQQGGGWYVLQVNRCTEWDVFNSLKKEKIFVFYPRCKVDVTVRLTGVRRRKSMPVLPGLMLVRLPRHPMAFAAVCGYRDVVGIVSDGEAPRRSSQKEVERFQELCRLGAFDISRRDLLKKQYAKGKRVVVKEGPFADFEAVIDRLNNQNDVRCLVSILGRETPVVLGVDQFKLLD